MTRLSLLAATAALPLLITPVYAGSGSFSGASGHVTSGSVTVTKSGGKLVVKLGSNFKLDGAPDPVVSLGNGSRPVKGGIIAKLKSNRGGQTYSVSVTPAREAARQVVIWCKKYAVPLGVATVK